MREPLALPGLRLVRRLSGDKDMPQILLLALAARSARCPSCQCGSRRIHSCYQRTVADLPHSGAPVCLKITVRRFFCRNRRCPRRIFAERLPEVAADYARRTERLGKAQARIAQAVGSRPGTRLAEALSMPTSATTLLRLERAASLPDVETPRVLGVDDFALRKGHRYGTILFDLESRRVVDLLSDREAQSLAQWLKEHPGVEIISRDRAGSYAEGARLGAPDATQVADRWHLVKNLGQTLERVLDTKRSLLKKAAKGDGASAEACETVSAELPVPRPTENELRREQEKQHRRADRQGRYEQARRLFDAGYNVSAIARQMDLSRETVRTFLHSETFPERRARARRPGTLDPYERYLQQRWQEGYHNAAQIFREIKEQGYRGGYSRVTDYLRTCRRSAGPKQSAPAERVSVRSVVAWALRITEERKPEQQAILERLLRLSEPLQVAFDLAQQFLELVRAERCEEQISRFRAWLSEASACSLAELRGLAASLKKDQAAVEAALFLPWSNGAVEGSVNRLKCIKRRGYGRANFDLLRRRVLQT